jgi:3-phosphoshikimate 1-carboxyvinyltransferase
MTAARAVTPLGRPLDAIVTLPGSKSATNRALVVAALAAGDSSLDGLLLADDTYAMIEGLRRLGVGIALDEAQPRATVHGSGGALAPGPLTIDCRLSGTVSRFLTAVTTVGPGPYTVDAAPSMRSRPMRQLVVALRDLGAVIEGDHCRRRGRRWRAGGAVTLPGMSSPFLSGLLLAAPYSPKAHRQLTTELVSKPYVDMTLATMASFGVDVVRRDYRHFVVRPGRYSAATVAIEPDATAASYFWAAAAICGGRVRVRGLSRTSGQGDVRLVDVLAAMGATVVADGDGIEVRVDAGLHGVTVDMADIFDTVPTSPSSPPTPWAPPHHGRGFIRRKESDRLGALVRELQRCASA